MGMVAYTIHELNSAIAKADAGNVDNDSGAPHNWDEGWAFFHGPDEDYGCSPAKVMEKRAADFGTQTDGVSNALTASQTAMVDGLAALQAGDSAGYTAAADTVVKNVVITYSQAVLKYTSKMDNADSGAKYQVEGYAFWKAIEAYSAAYTNACVDTEGNVTYVGDSDETACAAGETFDGHYGADKINEILNLQDASQLGTSYDVTAHLEHVWAHYGITSDDIGTYS